MANPPMARPSTDTATSVLICFIWFVCCLFSFPRHGNCLLPGQVATKFGCSSQICSTSEMSDSNFEMKRAKCGTCALLRHEFVGRNYVNSDVGLHARYFLSFRHKQARWAF